METNNNVFIVGGILLVKGDCALSEAYFYRYGFNNSFWILKTLTDSLIKLGCATKNSLWFVFSPSCSNLRCIFYHCILYLCMYVIAPAFCFPHC